MTVPRHIKELAKLLNGIKCRINLLRFHPIPDSPLKSPDENHIVWFRDALTAKGITTTIRASRGEDIFAACGLLSTKELLKKKLITFAFINLIIWYFSVYLINKR